MTVDAFESGEEQPYVGFSPEVSRRFYETVERLGRWTHVELRGHEHLPAGGALLVANHAFGFDVAFALARVRALTGRTVWTLGEHLWWKVPLVRRLAAAVGTVDGTQTNADALLSRGELVLVMPGGMREAVKPRELRYRLLWGHRYGFVRTAIRNQVPLVPLACIGADEMFDLFGNAVDRGRRWLRSARLPLPLPSHMPRLARLRYALGEPIPTAGSDDSDASVRRLRREVEGALHELIEHDLAARHGISLD